MKAPSLLCLLLALCVASAAVAADHREAPLTQEDPTADIADLYAFPSPADPSKLVLAMTVNPFSAPSEAVTYAFSPNVEYVFHLGLRDGRRHRDADSDSDSDSDSHAHHRRWRHRTAEQIRVRFSPSSPIGQRFVARFPDGTVVHGEATQPTEEPVPNPVVINEGPGGIRIFAGPRDDPFFFDVAGFFRFLAGTGGPDGTDGFAGFNVSAIVIELPFARLRTRDAPLQIWASTARRRLTKRQDAPKAGRLERIRPLRTAGPFEQVERMGNPAVSTVLVPSSLKDLFNVTRPENDATDFAGVLVESLQALGTNADNISILASVAVPDTLKLDPGSSVGFPNGRAPSDDVIDVLLGLVTNGAVTGDGVAANDVPFAAGFPFLAPPQQAP